MYINQEIAISKNEIFNKYNNLNTYTKNVINAIYGEEVCAVDLKCFYSKDIIKINGNNNIKILNKYKGKTGIYIFLDNDNIPVYIGVAGKIDSNHSIQDRLQKQFNCHSSNSTLSLNIFDTEKSYGNILTNSSKDDKKQLILNYTPKLLIINAGDLSCDNDVYTSLALEQVLISLFNSKYNK